MREKGVGGKIVVRVLRLTPCRFRDFLFRLDQRQHDGRLQHQKQAAKTRRKAIRGMPKGTKLHAEGGLGGNDT